MNKKLSRRDLGAVALGSGLAVAGAPSNAQSTMSSLSKDMYLSFTKLQSQLPVEAGFDLRKSSIDAPATLKVLIKYLHSEGVISAEEEKNLRNLVNIIETSTDFTSITRAINEAYEKISSEANEAFRAIVSILKGEIDQISTDYSSLSPAKKRRVMLKAFAGVLTAIAMLVKSFGLTGIAVAAVLGAAVAFLTALSDELPR